MKLNKIFLSMAALAFVGAMTAGCSGDDLTAQTPQLPDTTNGTVTMKINVSLSEHASTRELNPNFTKNFATGDKIAVIYKNTNNETVKVESDPLQATDILSNNSAKFSVTLTNPQASTPVRYIYPASMAADDVSATTPDNDATIKWTKLASQYNMLTNISSDLDLAVFDGTLSAQGILPAAELKNQLTIGNFTINNGTDNITENVKELIIYDGTNTYNIRNSYSSSILVIMKPITTTQTVTIKAITADNKFIKSVTNKELAKNTKYDIIISMTARYPLAVTAASVSSDDIGSVIGADGNIYLNAAAAAAATTTAQAVIAYVGNVPKYFDKLLAIAMEDADGNHQTWTDAHTKVGTFAASHAITIGSTPYNTNAIGAATCYDIVTDDVNASSATRTADVVKGWRMPSVTDWRYIFDGLGRLNAGLTLTAKSADGNTIYSSNAIPTDPLGVTNMYYRKDDDASSLSAAINAACGNTSLRSDNYWCSSDFSGDSGKAWFYNFYYGYGKFYCGGKTVLRYARAVFAY